MSENKRKIYKIKEKLQKMRENYTTVKKKK